MMNFLHQRLLEMYLAGILSIMKIGACIIYEHTECCTYSLVINCFVRDQKFVELIVELGIFVERLNLCSKAVNLMYLPYFL